MQRNKASLLLRLLYAPYDHRPCPFHPKTEREAQSKASAAFPPHPGTGSIQLASAMKSPHFTCYSKETEDERAQGDQGLRAGGTLYTHVLAKSRTEAKDR